MTGRQREMVYHVLIRVGYACVVAYSLLMAIKILEVLVELPNGKVVAVQFDTLEQLWQHVEEHFRLDPLAFWLLVRKKDGLEIPRHTNSPLDSYDLFHEDRLCLVRVQRDSFVYVSVIETRNVLLHCRSSIS